MKDFEIFAQPIWVNLFILLPFVLFYFWQKKKLIISNNTLLLTGIFGIAFGFIEAAVVIYLRAAIGFLPGYEGTLLDVWRQSYDFFYNQQVAAQTLPLSLLTVELLREGFTMVMIASVAIMTARKTRERFAIFLWVFAFWDIFYYVFLFLTVRWPQSLTTADVLFLIPGPWYSQVWLPILISVLTIFVVFISRKKG